MDRLRENPTNDQLCRRRPGGNSRDVTREPPSDRVRVLIVDDDDDFASAMRAALTADGRIDVAGIVHDGGQALEPTKSLRPDLVLLDLEMPRMDGYETLRRLNRRAQAARDRVPPA